MVGFVVADVEGAHRDVRHAGVEVSDIVWARDVLDNTTPEGYGSFFFTAPDGHTYVIQQVADPA